MARLICLLIFIVVLAPMSVHAAAVSPAMIDLSGGRGETIQSQFTIINPTNQPKVSYFSLVGFEPRDESASPRFLFDQTSGFPSWISLPSQSVTVPARSKMDVPFSVAIPSDVSSGSYFSSIFISDTPHELVADNGASISANIAVLLFLNVTGDVVARSAILDFVVEPSGIVCASGGRYWMRLQNQGNVYMVPKGTIEVRDVFGRLVSRDEINPEGSRLLPGTTRTYEQTFGVETGEGFFPKAAAQLRSLVIGPVTVKLSIIAGNNISATARQTVIPWQLLVCIFVAVTLLVVVSRFIRRKQRKV